MRHPTAGNCETGSGVPGTGYAAGDIGRLGDPQWLPIIDNLAAVAAAHPRLTFNLAVALRLFGDSPVDAQGEQIARSIEAAKILGRPPTPLPADWEVACGSSNCGPHLRMVDAGCRDTWCDEGVCFWLAYHLWHVAKT
eukprot:COSAG01_NODE_5856_length_3989_cov_4.375321_5_plen_138_part_00